VVNTLGIDPGGARTKRSFGVEEITKAGTNGQDSRKEIVKSCRS
jgi:hypothetical protein